MAEFVWLRHEFPWLGSGFLHAVTEMSADQFISQLEELGFTVVAMRCGAGESLSTSLKLAFGFPDWCGDIGQIWDAIHDCFREVEFTHPFALVWREVEGYAAASPKLFAEAIVILNSEFEALATHGIQAELVITGEGPSFSALS